MTRRSARHRPERRARGVVLGLAVVLSLLATLTGTAAADGLIIPPGHDQEILKLVQPYKLGGQVADGFELGDVNIGARQVDFTLLPPHGGAGRKLGVTLELAGQDQLGTFHYALHERPPERELTPPERRAVASLERAITAHATDAFWSGVTSWVPGPPTLPRGSVTRVFAAARAPYPAACFLCVLVLLVGGGLIARSRRERGVLTARTLFGDWRAWTGVLAVAVAAGVLPLAHWYLSVLSAAKLASLPLAFWHAAAWREGALASLALWVAAGALGLAVVGALARCAFERPSGAALGVAARWSLDVGAILVWSMFVRFALTHLNILTDGGSGYRRIQRYMPSFGGLSLLIRALMPDQARFMWSAIHVTALLAALGPPLLYVAARALGFERRTALLAGAALASLPLHAAMFTSDFLVGPLLSLQLLGIALVAASLEYERPELTVGGAALLAYTVWGRPDAAVIGGVLLCIVLRALRQWRRRPALIGGLAWFGLNVVVAQMAARAFGVASAPEWSLVKRLLPIVHFLSLQAIIPWWLWLPAPLGAWILWRRERSRAALVAVGLAAGLLPLSLGPGGPDPTRSNLELFRYGTWALPWLVLCAARGLDATAAWLSARWAARRGNAAIEVAPYAVLMACLAVTPLWKHAYLARIYGPRAEEDVFRQALGRVPVRCGVVVPDDLSDVRAIGHGTIEVLSRYRSIDEEAAARGRKVVSEGAVVGVTHFLNLLDRQHVLPPVPDARPGQAPSRCWYFFRGSYCDTGIDGHPPHVCRTLEQRVELAPVFTRRILYISHRFVTRPDLRSPPLYDPAQRLTLSRIAGLSRAAAAR